MRAVIREVPEHWLDERARLGLDRFDEIWEGVLHMVPRPSFDHQHLGTKLVAFLEPRLAARGVRVLYETGVFRPGAGGKDYRIPDLVFFPADRHDLIGQEGVVGAPSAVLEIRSPDDETYDKFPFWAALAVAEVIVIEPARRAAEVYRLAGAGYVATSADDRGRVHAASVDVRFSTVAGADAPRLRVAADGDAVEI